MKQSEQASLQTLQSLEQFPSPDVWERICLEWERGSLQHSMGVLSEQPNPSLWNRVAAKLAKRSNRLVYGTLLLLVLGSGSAVLYTFTSTNTTQVESIQLVSVTKENTPSSPIPPPPTLAEQTTITSAIQYQRIKKTNSKPSEHYLWLASKSGEPIRIHSRWQDLSCCLSGEAQVAECQEQKQQWHREIEASNLGFQADPLQGLIELMEPKANPSTFSPILCP